jgi:uncharacterized protein with HEPN domain
MQDADRDRVLLTHMLECISHVDAFCGGQRERFEASRLVQDAVVRNLHMLTESSQRLSDPIKASEPDVPWRELAGFRNVVVHGYLGLDSQAVWTVVEQDLPTLRAALERMLVRAEGR